jgi:hypothetical protein
MPMTKEERRVYMKAYMAKKRLAVKQKTNPGAISTRRIANIVSKAKRLLGTPLKRYKTSVLSNIELFKKYKFAWHFMGSPTQLQAIKYSGNVRITWFCECHVEDKEERKQFDHYHLHALLFTNTSRTVTGKLCKQVAPEDKSKLKMKRLMCLNHLGNCFHYLSCSRGQTKDKETKTFNTTKGSRTIVCRPHEHFNNWVHPGELVHDHGKACTPIRNAIDEVVTRHHDPTVCPNCTTFNIKTFKRQLGYWTTKYLNAQTQYLSMRHLGGDITNRLAEQAQEYMERATYKIREARTKLLHYDGQDPRVYMNGEDVTIRYPALEKEEKEAEEARQAELHPDYEGTFRKSVMYRQLIDG